MDYLIFRFLFLTTISYISLFGEIYILSYKIVVQNSVVTTDSLYLSKLMIPSKRFKILYQTSLESEERDSDRYIIEKNRDFILETLFKKGVIVKDYTTAINFQSRTKMVMILPPAYISIDRYYNNSSYLTILKEI